jgi:hypothetical protein
VTILDFNAITREAKNMISRNSYLESFVTPDYDLFNITNIESVVGKIFESKSLMKVNFPDDITDDANGVEKVILFIMDGLGYDRLVWHMQRSEGALRELADRGVLKAFSSTFPSTTSTALTSIFTGLTPSAHGVIGFNMFVPAYGLIFNTLNMEPVVGYGRGIDLAEDFSRDAVPWLPLLRDSGVKVKTFTRRNLAGSGLSRVIHRHQEIVGYALMSDLIVQIRKALEEPGSMFLCVYYAGVDTLEHAFGPYSDEASAELEVFERLLKSQLLDKLSVGVRQKTLLLVTADHGVVETMQSRFLNDPKITEHFLVPPTGDMRATYFFPKCGHEENLRDALEADLQGFSIVRSSELVAKGVFGGSSKLMDRLQTIVGTFCALSRSKNVVLYPYFPGERLQSVLGAHGGMTPEEMIIPLLSLRLSNW